MKYIIVIISIIGIMACTGCNFTRPKLATRILKNQGYTKIEITGFRFFKCSEDDWSHTGFKALSPIGAKVSGTLCTGLFFKSSTIRFD